MARHISRKGLFLLAVALLVFCLSVASLASALEKASMQESETQDAQEQIVEGTQDTGEQKNSASKPGQIGVWDEAASAQADQGADVLPAEDTAEDGEADAESSNAAQSESNAETGSSSARSVTHHSAYWRETVYTYRYHYGGAGTTCSLCGQHHDSSYTEAIISGYIDHVCGACGGKHAYDYDE